MPTPHYLRRCNAWLSADVAAPGGRGTSDRAEPAWGDPIPVVHQPPMVRGVAEHAEGSVRGRTVHQISFADDADGEAIRPRIWAEALVRLYHDDPATAGARSIDLSALAPPALDTTHGLWSFEAEHRA
jgi:hypothetical protein